MTVTRAPARHFSAFPVQWVALRPALRLALLSSTALVAALAIGTLRAHAATFTVANEADLANAITTANGNAEADTINVTGNITLTDSLPVLEDADGLTVDLGGNTVSGGGANRIFFVNSGTATIQNGMLADGFAQGGAGGLADDLDNGAGGGGMGAGGALFVRGDTAPTVAVNGVSFSNNAAQGGDGGSIGTADVGSGGGGGLGGDGGSSIGASAEWGGGGGGGAFVDGADTSTDSGGAGGGPNGGSGGIDGGAGPTAGGDLSGGGGGADLQAGAAGGYGGGGGGGGDVSNGGAGGFGGGGGGDAGAGGFGGGGGGDNGTGGFGGGNGGSGLGGGGGAGFGGAVFVQDGASVTISGSSTASGGSVTSGAGNSGGQNGSAAGSGLFLQNSGVTLASGAGETLSIADSIADDTGNGGNAGSLTIDGAGTVELTGANTFSGGVTVAGGTFRLGSDTAAGTGTITTTGSTLSFADGVNSASPINLSSNDTRLEVNGGESAEQSGVISETGGARSLEKIGDGTLVLSGTNTYTGATTVSAGTLGFTGAITNQAGSTLEVGDGATFEADSITNDDGGTINVGVGSTLSGTGNTINNAGVTNVADTGTVQDAGAINNLASGVYNFNGNGTMTVDTDGVGGEAISNAGDMNFNGGAGTTVNINSGSGTANLTNSGTFDVAADSTVSSADTLNIDNTSGAITVGAGGTLNVNDLDTSGATGSIDNDGTVALGAGQVLENAGTLSLSGTITGDVTNTNDFTVDGATANVSGTLTNLPTGTATIGSDFAAGGIANSGDFDLNSGTTTVTGGTTNNGGTFDIANGATLDTTGVFLTRNTGTLTTIDGVVQGDANALDSGGIDLNSTGNITGDLLVDDASADLTGNVDGNLINRNGGDVDVTGSMTLGGNLTNQAVLDVTGLGTVMTVTGTGSNNLGGSLTIGAGSELSLGTLVNTGAGSVSTVNGTLNGDATNVSDGQLIVNTGGEVTGTTTVESGTVTNAATIGDALVNDGTLATSGVAANITNAGGNVNVTGGTVANLNNTSGSSNVSDGSITGVLSTSGGNSILGVPATVGQVQVDGTGVSQILGTVNGTSVATGGGVLVSQGGTFNGNVSTTNLSGGGNLQISGATSVTGDVTNDGSTTVLNGGANSLTLAGSGIYTNTGTTVIRENATLSAVTINNNGGQISVGTGASLIGTGNTLNNNAAIVVNDGGTVMDAGAINNNATGSFDFIGSGTFNADSDNDGDTVENAGTIFSRDGGGHTITLGDGVADVFNNLGTGNVTIGGSDTFSGTATTFNNAGALNFGPGSTMSIAQLNNTTGTLAIDGAASLNVPGGLDSDGTLSFQDGATNDMLTINGNTDLSGTLRFDADLSGVTDTADFLDVNGTVSSSAPLTLAFNNAGASIGSITTAIDLLEYDAGSIGGFTTQGLPTFGAFVYAVNNNAATNTYQLVSAANPGINVGSTVSLTQSLIGGVINRPSSPFVAGLAVGEGQNPCGHGIWGRVVGGTADVTGTIETNIGSFGSEVSADYYGFQMGGDFACFDGHYNGWDLSFGGIAGINHGDTSQPVFQFDPATGLLDTSQIDSFVKTDFRQIYSGIYLGAARDRFFADLQFRAENTEFDLSNPAAVAGGGLGLPDQKFESEAYTLSGSVSYAIPVNEEQRVTFIPTAGFSYTWTETEEVVFDNGTAVTADDSVLKLKDSTTEIGFIGATLAKTQIQADGRGALNYFVTGTVYHDFAPDIKSTLTAAAGGSSTSTSSNLGTFGELSVGVNFSRLLDSGGSMPGRQFNASVRLDGRSGDDIDSWGLTAQARLQF